MIRFFYFSLSTLAMVAAATAVSPAAAQSDSIDKDRDQAESMFRVKEEIKLVPGVLEAERGSLLKKILVAEEAGVGVKNYLTAFKYIESLTEKGADASVISPRLSSINTSLDEQLKRSRILKTQKLPPPIAASSPPPSQMGGKPAGKSASGKQDLLNELRGRGQGEVIDKLKDKWFGGDLPDSVKNKIPAGFDPSKLSKEDMDRLMQRLR